MNQRLKKNRGGIAMMLVVVLMASAAIMGFALLSSASLQAQAGKNATSAVCADGLAESATNLSLYYMMNPAKASSSLIGTNNGYTYFNPGTNVPSMNLTNGASISNVVVSMVSAGTYNVDVTATSSSPSGSITRSTRTVVSAPSRYITQYSMAANDSFTLPLTFLTSSVTGTVRCDGGYGGLTSVLTGILFGSASQASPTYPKEACPVYSEINLCKSLPTYTYNYATNHTSYTAIHLTSGSLQQSNFTAPNSTTNPGAVYYIDQDVTLKGTINLTGTLIVSSGHSLTLNNSANVTITPKIGYPALIIANNLICAAAGQKLTVNGVCWIGGQWTGSGVLPGAIFTVKGSLMWGGTGAKIDSTKLTGVTSQLLVSWPTSASTQDPPTPDVCYVPELCNSGQTAKSVKIVSIGAVPITSN
jgi:Tfp pilus assembly protein PilV